jgi:hypothetical protein
MVNIAKVMTVASITAADTIRKRQKMIRPTLHPTYNVGIMYVIKNDRNYRLDFEEI